MPNKITHLTVTTGHSRFIGDGEVSAATVAVMRDWLPRLQAAGTLPLPMAALSHFSATLIPVGDSFVLTVNAPAAPHSQGKPHRGRVMPLVTIGIATTCNDADTIWQSFCKINPDAMEMQPPPLPWCAVILYPTLAAYPGGAGWLGDFERCLAVAAIKKA